MTKIDIISGFLGAGKTTLIKKLLEEAYTGEQVVLIENEFGQIGIDSGFLQDAGIQITEMNSGCICCSLVGDFTKALSSVIDTYHPDRIIIEPSGVGKLSDVIRAASSTGSADAVLNGFTTVVDAKKCKMYMKNFGEFFNDQVAHAGAIVLSHTTGLDDNKLAATVAMLREQNPHAVLVSTPWEDLTGADLLRAMERRDTLEAAMDALAQEHEHHHEHAHSHDETCTCGCHDHDHDHCHEHHHDHEHCHEHHHDHAHCDAHSHDETCTCGCHDHDHDHAHCDAHSHDETCTCGCHDHHHHADEVFESFGVETTRRFTEEELTSVLDAFSEDPSYGLILRAKGIVPAADGRWLHFDYVPDEPDIRYGTAAVIGRLCVIGSKIDKDKIRTLLGV